MLCGVCGLSSNDGACAMSMVVIQIIAKEPVRFSLDNGVTLSEFTPKQVYEVPDYAANSMIKRKWAKHVTAADIETADLDTEIELGDLHETAQGEDHDEHDEHDEGEGEEGGEEA